MGYSTKVHVGPFLRCVPHEGWELSYDRYCPKGHGITSAFCSVCGAAGEKRKQPTPVPSGLEDLGIDEDRLSPVHPEDDYMSQHLFVSNQGPQPREFIVRADEDDSGIIAAGPIGGDWCPDPAAEVDWFVKWLGEDLARLRAAYKSVSVEWGIVLERS